ncbi:hypothetical protein GOAMR_75_00180 [Gordonia amarae NBRC 15530]|uniref:Uncharacterized protein n=1 Tax=Gordonia amarae NBRC 15530 TaxID=1075090 RepID=G7GW83_9ACTN|nr:hypothetical protein GOAMR_75_00180 [Gordonia amarae NBRC 15530]
MDKNPDSRDTATEDDFLLEVVQTADRGLGIVRPGPRQDTATDSLRYRLGGNPGAKYTAPGLPTPL